MAKAPRPGVGARKEASDRSRKIMTITIERDLVTKKKGKPIPRVLELAPLNLPIKQQMECRRATGMPFSAFWSERGIAEDSLVTLWWMARRMNGEPGLAFEVAVQEWPDDLDYETEIDIDFDDGSDDDEDVAISEDTSPEG